jgi:signal transduction histidine kinase
MMLETQFPLAIACGKEFAMLYNDGYRPILGASKHPALGRRLADVFPESWEQTIGPLFAQVIRGGERREEQRAQVEMARRNALRQLKLANTLLDFARIEAGRAEAVYEPTDLPQLTADLASAFRAAVENAGLQLIVECPPLPEPIYVDSSSHGCESFASGAYTAKPAAFLHSAGS